MDDNNKEEKLLNAWKSELQKHNGLPVDAGYSKICKGCGRFFYSYYFYTVHCGICVPNSKLYGNCNFRKKKKAA